MDSEGQHNNKLLYILSNPSCSAFQKSTSSSSIIASSPEKRGSLKISMILSVAISKLRSNSSQLAIAASLRWAEAGEFSCSQPRNSWYSSKVSKAQKTLVLQQRKPQTGAEGEQYSTLPSMNQAIILLIINQAKPPAINTAKLTGLCKRAAKLACFLQQLQETLQNLIETTFKPLIFKDSFYSLNAFTKHRFISFLQSFQTFYRGPLLTHPFSPYNSQSLKFLIKIYLCNSTQVEITGKQVLPSKDQQQLKKIPKNYHLQIVNFIFLRIRHTQEREKTLLIYISLNLTKTMFFGQKTSFAEQIKRQRLICV